MTVHRRGRYRRKHITRTCLPARRFRIDFGRSPPSPLNVFCELFGPGFLFAGRAATAAVGEGRGGYVLNTFEKTKHYSSVDTKIHDVRFLRA